MSVDVQLPDLLEGRADILSSYIHEVGAFLSSILVNGIIAIEVLHRGSREEHTFLSVELTGRGMRTGVELERVIHAFVADFKPADVAGPPLQFVLSPDSIHFEFKLGYHAQADTPNSFQPFHNRKILIAEDNTINAMVFSSFVEEWGCSAEVVPDGEAAVQSAHDHPADLILMDIHMPHLDGITAIEQIRRFNAHIPIIALTASTLDDDLRAALRAGANDNLLKPVSSSVLFSLLSRYL